MVSADDYQLSFKLTSLDLFGVFPLNVLQSISKWQTLFQSSIIHDGNTPISSNCQYQWQMLFVIGGSMPKHHWNAHCTTDSVLLNCRTQSALCCGVTILWMAESRGCLWGKKEYIKLIFLPNFCQFLGRLTYFWFISLFSLSLYGDIHLYSGTKTFLPTEK